MPTPADNTFAVTEANEGATTDPRPEEFKKFKKVLYEIFQFDVADLDFGIYRILNEKRDAVDRFIEEDLHEAVTDGIRTYVEGQTEELRKQVAAKREELEEAGQQLGQNVFTDDGDIAPAFEDSPLAEEYVQLNEKLRAAEMAKTTERRVYDDLAKFFRRYYDEGDFITQRRFQAGDSKYVVPYNGEEVMLHWANRDQYYVKTSEHFKNYRFEARDYDVEFKLVDAESPKDNVKENDTRYFVLHGDDPVSVDTEAKTCTITMAYRAITEDEKEAIVNRYNEEAGESKSRLKRRILCTTLEARILDDIEDATLEALLTQPRKADEDVGRLYAHLKRYVAANTADYFVHKDLEDFLSGQLEYFIQNEVLDLDDVLAGETPSVAQQAVNRAKVVKSVGERVITFLAQIENFQKRLFEKKKFVVDTGYCITLDRVPDELYGEILDNDEQLDEWRELYAVDEWEDDLFGQGYRDGTFMREFLVAHPHVMIDTGHFDQAFVDTLLAHLSTLGDEGINGVVDGLCIQGENFQALNLLQERFREKVQCVYIDPPYNTDATPILYKNGFRSSSWLTMLSDRLQKGKVLTKPNVGSTCVAIDDHELANLSKLLGRSFSGCEIHRVVVNHYPGSGTGRSNVTRTHEYAMYVVPDHADILRGEEKEDGIRERSFRRSGTGENNYRSGRPNSFYAVLVDDEAFEIKGFEPPPEEGTDYPEGINEDGWLRVYPIGEDGSERVWTLSYESALQKWKKMGDDILYCTDNLSIKRKYYDEGDRSLLESLWVDSKFSANNYGTNLLTDMFGESGLFSYPKSVHTVRKAVESITHNLNSPLVLDYFAGSGTTGHAVMEMNRDSEVDGESRKYILVDMGEYFSTVMLPRLRKVAFSSDWKDGVPQGNDGMSHAIQYHRLESYEDALNNIEIDEPNDTQRKIFDAWDDYEMRYMFDEETGGSETLLQPEAFENPYDYTLRIQHGMESPKQHAVDLEATFNYLIGLNVKTRRVHHNPHLDDRRYVVVTGTVESDDAIEDVVVIWRDREGLDEDDLRREKAWMEAEVIDAASFDSVYVNGKSFITGAEPLEIMFREKMDPAR